MKTNHPLKETARRLITVFCLTCAAPIIGTTASCSETVKPSNGTIMTQETKSSEKFLGGLSSDKALAYMKATPGIYIIDVREPEWYDGYTQFTGNVHIPCSKLAERHKEIPKDRPVILNCGMGMVAPRAYKLLKELDIDVVQLSYIAGSPRFREYNEWAVTQKDK